MNKMRFIRHYQANEVEKMVNKALDDGYEYLETHFVPMNGSTYTSILVVMCKS